VSLRLCCEDMGNWGKVEDNAVLEAKTEDIERSGFGECGKILGMSECAECVGDCGAE